MSVVNDNQIDLNKWYKVEGKQDYVIGHMIGTLTDKNLKYKEAPDNWIDQVYANMDEVNKRRLK